MVKGHSLHLLRIRIHIIIINATQGIINQGLITISLPDALYLLEGNL